eukprot:1770111-Rhodomonas_salina.1
MGGWVLGWRGKGGSCSSASSVQTLESGVKLHFGDFVRDRLNSIQIRSGGSPGVPRAGSYLKG